MCKSDFCYVKHFKLNPLKASAVSFVDKYWPNGSLIYIYLQEGFEQEEEFIQALDEVFSYCNLAYQIVSNRMNADIRVGFNPGIGSWSYLGTDALGISKLEDTMNIGWVSYTTYLHEICHAIGAMAHEHQNPELDFEWDEDAIFADLSGPPNYWTLEDVKVNITNPVVGVDATGFDPSSIMLYSIPDHWVKDGYGFASNSQLSKTDKEWLRKLYPSEEAQDVTAPDIILKGEIEYTVYLNESWVEPGFTALDDNDGDISDNVEIISDLDLSKVGSYTIVYRVSDEAKNTAVATRVLNVKKKSWWKRLLEWLSRLFT